MEIYAYFLVAYLVFERWLVYEGLVKDGNPDPACSGRLRNTGNRFYNFSVFKRGGFMSAFSVRFHIGLVFVVPIYLVIFVLFYLAEAVISLIFWRKPQTSLLSIIGDFYRGLRTHEVRRVNTDIDALEKELKTNV